MVGGCEMVQADKTMCLYYPQRETAHLSQPAAVDEVECSHLLPFPRLSDGAYCRCTKQEIHTTVSACISRLSLLVRVHATQESPPPLSSSWYSSVSLALCPLDRLRTLAGGQDNAPLLPQAPGRLLQDKAATQRHGVPRLVHH
jgi:hypothetical protein